MPVRVLLVEDEFLVALDTKTELEDLGYEVAYIARSVGAALKAMENGVFDLAVLDVNLNGERVWPVAEALRQRSLPFIFSTAYGELLRQERPIVDAPVIGKPFSSHEFRAALAALQDEAGN